jgi:hypothetical protein
MFLALMNSVDDVIRDRVVLHRERNLDVRLPYYIFAKFTTLALFSAVQCALFVIVGNAILEVRGMFWPYFTFMLITAASGTSLGLLISSIVNDSKTAANFVPLVLIPQLIFGGALIKYEEMNRDMDVVYTFNRWFSTHPEVSAGNEREDAKLRIPLISRLVATHYSYEALVVAQAKLNPLSIRQDRLQDQIDALIAKKNRTEADGTRLEDLKDTLALLSGLESGSQREIEKRLRRVDQVIEGRPLDPGGLRSRTTGVTAERLYTNQKITDLVAKAETEQSDYRRQMPVNVFFSPEKHYEILRIPEIRRLGIRGRNIAIHASVYLFNGMVLVVSSLLLMCALYLIVKKQLRPKGM